MSIFMNLEVVSRHHDSRPQVGENRWYLFNLLRVTFTIIILVDLTLYALTIH